MNYEQLISTPCSALSTMSYSAYRELLNESYRQMIILEAGQKQERNLENWQIRQLEISALESHIRTLYAASYYKQFLSDFQKDINTLIQAAA